MATTRNKKTFEEQMDELQEIVNRLQKGDLTLEDSIKQFKNGMKLANKLQTQLDKADETLAQLMGNDGDLHPAEKAGEDLSNNGIQNQGYHSEFTDQKSKEQS
ncbi:exodeoxyribonuclease VII small subunit [uncultured Limosilactobacillus sp.]|uniref:exodeoxyribonuclease VII small subunit n=1 Tax=uncultured Limosilactobacillus sp. TaxID=2837629 RepID=UPI0025E39457|nr:exodeoxyribonuclease VII small subunit [uncultured Limosilactobacillus sp.]